MIITQQPITSCCYFHNRDAVEKQCRENSKDICCAFVIPLALKKQVFNTVIFTEKALGVFSSVNVFLFLLLALPL